MFICLNVSAHRPTSGPCVYKYKCTLIMSVYCQHRFRRQNSTDIDPFKLFRNFQISIVCGQTCEGMPLVCLIHDFKGHRLSVMCSTGVFIYTGVCVVILSSILVTLKTNNVPGLLKFVVQKLSKTLNLRHFLRNV